MAANLERVFQMKFSSVYPLYIQKAERKGKTKEEVDTIITWLTGYSVEKLQEQIEKEVNFKTFLKKHLNYIRTYL